MPTRRPHIPRPFAYGWWIVLGLTIFFWGFAFVNFGRYLVWQGQNPYTLTNLLNSAYRALQLFVLTWDPPSQPVPMELQIIRFPAGLMPFAALFLAVLQSFRERLTLFWHQLFRRNHFVLCGLGERGVDLVHYLRAEGRKVVVIEAKENHPDLVSCRALRAMVLIGSPLDRHVLHQARVDRADTLLSLFQEDAASVETLISACELNSHRPRGSLHCIVQIYDHTLMTLLDKYELFQKERDRVNLELFNLFDIAAQVMLRESPAVFRKGQPRRLLIVGMGWLGQVLLQRVHRSWQIDRLAKQEENNQDAQLDKLEVIVVDRDCKELKSRLEANGVIPMDGFHLISKEIDVEGVDFVTGKFLTDPNGGKPIDTAFICLAEDRLALLAAVQLRGCFGASLPIVVRMTTHSGGAKLLNSEAIQVVGFQDLASTMPLVTHAMLEMLASEIHRDYVLEHSAHGETAQTNKSLAPWHKLDEHLQNSNREVAADLDNKLASRGCEKYPVKSPEELFAFTEKEVEDLAREEHDRWYKARSREGYRRGAKDIANKVSPSFVPTFGELSEGDKEYNRAAMRRLPVWLAKAGFGIRRLATAPAQGPSAPVK